MNTNRKRDQQVLAQSRRRAQDGVGLAHQLQVLHERQHVRVLHDDLLDVDREHLEAGLLHEGADVGRLDERRHTGRKTAAALHLGQLQRRAQLEQRVAGKHGPDKAPVRLQRVVQLLEDRRQVVDPVQRQVGHNDVEHVLLRQQRV
ncbi:hypothetical protein KL912_005177 [Ogataea haglerorum]|nr:hypothetical protein KL912_005177 [Ogataea haglerorum]